jgi:PAS domain S-box-containing protein
VTKAIVGAVRAPLVVLDANRRILSASDAFCRDFGIVSDGVAGRSLYELDDGRWDVPALRALLDATLDGESPLEECVVSQEVDGIGVRSMRVSARRISEPEQAASVLLSIEDITEKNGRGDGDDQRE